MLTDIIIHVSTRTVSCLAVDSMAHHDRYFERQENSRGSRERRKLTRVTGVLKIDPGYARAESAEIVFITDANVSGLQKGINSQRSLHAPGYAAREPSHADVEINECGRTRVWQRINDPPGTCATNRRSADRRGNRDGFGRVAGAGQLVPSVTLEAPHSTQIRDGEPNAMSRLFRSTATTDSVGSPLGPLVGLSSIHSVTR